VIIRYFDIRKLILHLSRFDSDHYMSYYNSIFFAFTISLSGSISVFILLAWHMYLIYANQVCILCNSRYIVLHLYARFLDCGIISVDFYVMLVGLIITLYN
jgi:hypothetical protein